MFPFYFISLSFRNARTHDFAHSLNRLWGRFITIPTFIRVSSSGKEHLLSKGVYVFAPNHRSYMDIPACHLAIPGSFRFMGKAELDDLPLFGWMYSRLHISVKRESKMSSYQAFIEAGEKIASGRSVVVFAEGGIPKDKSKILHPFKDGAFRLAIENKVPLVPVSISGSDTVFPDDGRLLARPGKIVVTIHPPIATTLMNANDLESLKQEARRIIGNHLEQFQSRMKNPA